MFSLREKLTLQKTVKAGIDNLRSGIADLRARLTTQKEIRDALAKLGEKMDKVATTLERLLAGEFTKADPLVFGNRLREAAAELDDGIEPLICSSLDLT